VTFVTAHDHEVCECAGLWTDSYESFPSLKSTNFVGCNEAADIFLRNSISL